MTTTPRIKLSKVFDEFISAYESLRDVTEEKQDAIFDRDFDKLEELTEKQAALAEQLDTINDRKLKLAERHLDEAETVDGLTLRKLQEKLSTPQDEVLSEKRVELKQLIRDVQRYTTENKRLLESRMDLFEELFQELSQDETSETYDSDSEKDATNADEAVIFDEAI